MNEDRKLIGGQVRRSTMCRVCGSFWSLVDDGVIGVLLQLLPLMAYFSVGAKPSELSCPVRWWFLPLEFPSYSGPYSGPQGKDKKRYIFECIPRNTSNSPVGPFDPIGPQAFSLFPCHSRVLWRNRRHHLPNYTTIGITQFVYKLPEGSSYR